MTTSSPIKTLCCIIGFSLSIFFLLALLAFKVEENKQSFSGASMTKSSVPNRRGLPLEILHQLRDGMSVQEVADLIGDKSATEVSPTYGWSLVNGGGVYFSWEYTSDAQHGFGDPQAKVLVRFEATDRYSHFIYDSWHIHSPSDDSILSAEN